MYVRARVCVRVFMRMCVSPSQLDVTFPRMGCAIMSLDAMDISGDQHLDVVSTRA